MNYTGSIMKFPFQIQRSADSQRQSAEFAENFKYRQYPKKVELMRQEKRNPSIRGSD